MWKNSFRIAWRSLIRRPGFALLNVGGLALGIAAAFVLGLYVRQELTHDQHFEASDRIYRVATDFYGMGGFAKSQQQLASVLQHEAAAVELATHFDRGFSPTRVVVDDVAYEEPHYFFVDSTFFRMFSYRFLEGQPETAMRRPDDVVLSETTARKYFGEASALGRMLFVGEEERAYRVAGVVAAPPGETHLAADLWLPLEPEAPHARWTHISYYTYVRLRPGGAQADLDAALADVLRHHAYPASDSDGTFEEWRAGIHTVHFWTQPLEDIYLHSDYRFEVSPSSNSAQVYALGLIAVLLLLIAGMNYVNLTTARSSVRAREVGVKKTLGASRFALVRQFVVESVALSLLAMLVAALLAEWMLWAFTFVTGDVLVKSLFAEFSHMLALLGFSVAVGLLAGLYPALFLSRYHPATVLKGSASSGGSPPLRKTLVVTQFAIAIALIIGSLGIYRQLDFMRHADKGLDHEGVLVIENAALLGPRAEAFQREVDRMPGVERTSFAERAPAGSGVRMYTYQTPAMSEPLTIQAFPADEDYVATLGMRLVAGRTFWSDLASDSSAVILNEAAVRALGLGEDPIGAVLNENQHVIGVVHDFNYGSMRDRIEPTVLVYEPNGRHLLLKLGGPHVAGFVDRLRATWEQFVPGESLAYTFLDDRFARLAAKEHMLGRAVAFFTLLSILIACMGLFGLATFTAERRTKEIGVRKVLGASVAGIVALLSRDVVRLVLIALLLAAPLAYLTLQRWLDGFAYRVEPSWWIFLLSGLMALGIALLTISYQAVRAALADPVESLRYE